MISSERTSQSGGQKATSDQSEPAANINAFAPPTLSLPKGGGAIRGMGEKFAANPVTGTGSMTVPIATSPGRSGFGPQLAVSYDSGAGNGPFGLGWNLSLPAITRKTDKGLPQYYDADDSDVFILSGAEDLVPVLEPGGKRFEDKNTFPGFVVHRYRPRSEGLFARIERWTHIETGEIHWRSISKDNITTLYGRANNSRIFDPTDPNYDPNDPKRPPTRIFSWLISQSYDDKGNAIVYDYRAENNDELDLSLANERNRVRTANRYLKRIRYGNRTPNRDNQGQAIDQATLLIDDWMFEVVFDYSDHDRATPAPRDNETKDDAGILKYPWEARPDPFSSYRAGFEVRTYRLCQRVLMFHHIPDLPTGEAGYDGLVRSTDFTYGYEVDAQAAANPVYSKLLSVTQSGHKRNGDEYISKSMPPLEFTYSEARLQNKVYSVDATSLENLPVGLDGAVYQWTDLHGEGIPGILTEQAGAWFYKRNLSPINIHGFNGTTHLEAKFAPVELVALKPNLALGNGAQFMDLAGDGQPDLVVMDGPLPGFYEHDLAEGWNAFRPFTARLNRDTRDPNLKFVDLNGDGHADVLITEDQAFVWHPSLGEAGFGPARRVQQTLDEEKGPRLVFADGEQAIYLADLSGDGLTDLARIRNGEVCYWPNLGYGRFGGKVTMDNAPWFDTSDQFNQQRIRLADIDGSGTTDIIYLHGKGVRIYFNQSGNSWSTAQPIPFPAMDNLAAVQAVDLLADSTACLVWSSPLPGAARCPLHYVKLMGEQKPHLLVKTVNNLGAETVVQYAPSTRFYLADKYRGKPWITRLPFPVHVVERVESYDRVSGNRFVARYAYHHGYFDGEEREFRGFGMVEQWDTEEIGSVAGNQSSSLATNLDLASFVPPVHTKTWFHTGVYLERQHVSDFFAGLLDSEDIGEYYREPGLTDVQARELLLPDTVLPDGLTLDEERQACRALKGAMLRQETYALDGTPKEEHPYTVTEQNFTIQRLQLRGTNRHAVFFTHPREAISFHYERNPDDPRIQHALTLEVDPYGNVLKQAAIGYGRRQPDGSLPLQVDRNKQTQVLITYTENRVTNPINDATVPDDYRAPLPTETHTYELTGYPPTGPVGRFQSTDFVQPAPTGLTHVFDSEINYEAVPTNGKQRRLIEHVRTLYRRNDLTAPLALGQLQSLALPFESYKLAFSPGLLTEVYGGRVTTAMLATEGGYVHSEGDVNWWIRSGQIFFSATANITNPAATAVAELAEARQHFFLPRKFSDPFDQSSTVDYDLYVMLAVKTEDAVQNTVTARHDYRVLQPRQMTDPNGNRTEAAFDALGMVVGTAVMGKATPASVEGDSFANFTADLTPQQIKDYFDAVDPRLLAVGHLGTATTRILYDLDRVPACAATIARETHVNDLVAGAESKVQLSFSYSDGFGREVQKKIQAEADLGVFADDLLTDSPVAYFRLSESVGATQATDASGNGNHGNVSATEIVLQQPGLGAGDSAARFSGQGSGRIVVPDSVRLNPKHITLEALISWAGPIGPTQQRIVEKSFSTAAPSQPTYGLSILQDGGVRVELLLKGRPEPVFVTGKAKLTANIATHLAATYDGSTIEIYINGILDVSFAAAGEILSTFGSSNIGIGNQVERERQFNGLLDEVALYDKALSADRIRAHVAKVKVGNTARPRWVGSGWTIFNNKGKPVRQYEPFFSPSHHFEFGVTVGVSPWLFYDPVERVIATLHPNHTWEKVVFDPWQQATFDVNDTVTLIPSEDDDVKGFLLNPDGTPRLPASEYRPTWHELRSDPIYAIDFAARYPDPTDRARETGAATKTVAHAATPAIAHFDTLGRPFLTLADNGPDPTQPGQHLLFATRVELDIEGNQRAVRDAIEQTGDPQGRIVMRYDYDLLGNRIHQASMEAGERWMLNDVAGKPIRAWDSRGFLRRLTYDELRRLTGLFVTENGVERLAERTVYGEGQGVDNNHKTQVYQISDSAGVVTNEAFDFKGNLLRSKRDLLPDYKQAVDWDQNPMANDGAFTTSMTFDALNRPKTITTPDNSIYGPTFSEANLLDKVEVNLRGEQENGQPKWTSFVTNLNYNAKGQRELIAYQNGTQTTYRYDPLTFRLMNLRTTRPAGLNGLASQLFADPTVVQDLRYSCDPVGNITRIEDAALAVIFHNNEQVRPVCEYTYDAIYRLLAASGREHIGQSAFDFNPPNGNRRDYSFFGAHANPNNPQEVRNYSERYIYDEVGNILQMIHQATNGNWTRDYDYAETSLLQAGEQSNRLTRTHVGAHTESYTYQDAQGNDVHGCMTAINGMAMTWDFEDQLQQVNLGGGGTAYYIYDAGGQRVRKVIERQNGTRREERIYVGGFEVYREYDATGATTVLARESLHIMDDTQCIAIVETKTVENGNLINLPPPVQRYQFGNHLGSASLELDRDGGLITYEEYHPYGTTAFQAGRSAAEVSLKRYRYTGKERDEESGLYYHGARYYAPWLGRWISCEPKGLVDGLCLYSYARSNPIKLIDPDGNQPAPSPPLRLPGTTAEGQTFLQRVTAQVATSPNAPVVFRDRGVSVVVMRLPEPYVVQRGGAQTFTGAARASDTPASETVINTNLYEYTGFGGRLGAGAAAGTGPTDPANWPAQGQVVSGGSVVGGRSSPNTYNFSWTGARPQQLAAQQEQAFRSGGFAGPPAPPDPSDAWQFGQGNPPRGADVAFGGGIPVIIGGLPFGTENQYTPGAPAGLPRIGDPGAGNQRFLTQRSNAGFSSQEAGGNTLGKVVMGIERESNLLILVVQEHGSSGMQLSEIRDSLIHLGVDDALAWDGSDSATLVRDSTVSIQPGSLKDNTIPFGAGFRLR